MQFKRLTLASLVLACFPQVAFAALQAYEGFEFDGPAIAGQGSGFGWNAEWINTAGNFQFVTSDDISLDSGAFAFTPAGNRVQTPNTPRSAEAPAARNLSNPFALNADGQLFMSFLIQKESVTEAAGNNLEVSLQSGSTHRARLGSTSDNKFFLTTSSSAAAGQISEQPHNFSETYFAVMKIVASATANHQLFARLYTVGAEPPTSEPTEWDLTTTAAAAVTTPIDRIRISAGAFAWGALDEIRIGTTFADVAIPMTSLPGDFNGDGTVDPADYVKWRKELGTAHTPEEYDEWVENFGSSSGGGAGPGVSFAAIPEPSAFLLVVSALALTVRKRRQR